MIVNGTISIDTDKKTVTIKLDNGSYCIDHYPNGIKRFLDEEFECLIKQENKPNITIEEADQLAYDHYEKGGDAWIECWEPSEKQKFIEQYGLNAKEELLSLFRNFHERAEGIRNA